MIAVGVTQDRYFFCISVPGVEDDLLLDLFLLSLKKIDMDFIMISKEELSDKYENSGNLIKVILQHTWGLFLQKNLSNLLSRSERSAHSFGLSPPPSPPLWCLTFRHRRSSLALAKPIVASPTTSPLDETTTSFSSLIFTCFSWRTPSSPH